MVFMKSDLANELKWSDLHAVNGDWPLDTKLPLVGGHEGAGVIVAKGELVEDIEIGDHAGVKVYLIYHLALFAHYWKFWLKKVSFQWINGSCLNCSFCQQSDEPLCAKALLSGYTVDGTFQQYCIAKAAHVARLSKDVALDAVAPVLCAGITVYKGLKESGARPGQTIAIVGAGGGLGSLACQYAKAMGLEIIAIDGGAEKAAMTKKLGARAFVDFQTSKNLVQDVKAATADGFGPHAVLLVAVNEKPFQQAAEVIRSPIKRLSCPTKTNNLMHSMFALVVQSLLLVSLPAPTFAPRSSSLLSRWLPSRVHTSATDVTQQRL
jgi:alcohol dehydrogenase, propanol-preferring